MDPILQPAARPDLASLGLGTAGLAHDLRNLLQIISSAVQLIDREVDRGNAAAVHRLAKSAQASVDRATALSREIITSTDADDEQLVSVAIVLVTLRDLISLTVGPTIQVEILSSDGIPAVRCSRRKLENALLNLVANARDAMPDGGRLKISLFLDETAVNLATGRFQVAVKVDDTGQGMSQATLRSVLTPFFTTKPADRGTGIGLSSVRDFVAGCGGSVTIESILGEGTSVLLHLPCNAR
jgi:signal transduction histidine kinase